MSSVLINQSKEIVEVPLEELLELQDSLKKTTSEAYRQFRDRVLAEGFKYIFFFWQDREGSKYIIDGHHRKKFLLKMADEGIEIPGLYPAISIEAETKREAVKELLFLNSRYGEITHTGLKQLLQNYQIKPMEVKGVRLRPVKVSLAKVLVEIEEEENATCEDDVLPDSAPPLTHPGDLWQLNNHRLLCGDARKKEHMTTLMENSLANMVFVDPPYNISIKKDIGGEGGSFCIQDHKEFAMAAGEMSTEEFTNFLQTVCCNLADFSLPATIHYICMDWRHIFELLTAGRITYTELKNICIWNKDLAGMGTFYRSKHELIVVYKNGEGKHINNFELGQYGRTRTNVWDYPQVNSFANGSKNPELYMHPTVKPVRMVYDCCLDCSFPGQLVLDTFLGSGTTLIACEKSGRLCYGMELDSEYCDLVVKRWVTWMKSNGKKITAFKRNGSEVDINEVLHGEK